MVSNQVEPRRRYQSGELLNQFQGGKQQMRGTIRPRRLKAKGQLFVVGDLQATSCQRRARGVTDEAFQIRSVVSSMRVPACSEKPRAAKHREALRTASVTSHRRRRLSQSFQFEYHDRIPVGRVRRRLS